MEFIQNEVSKRFVEAFHSLKEMKAFTTQQEAAEKLDFSPNTLSEILKGKRDVTIELLRKFFNTYKIRPSFIFDSALLKEEEFKNIKTDKRLVFPFNHTNEYKLVELNIRKIDNLYQRIVDIYVMSSTLNFDTDFDETNPFAEQRNKVIDNSEFKKMNINQLVEYNRELESIINNFEDYFFKKHRDLFYNVVLKNKGLKPVVSEQKPSKKKK